MKIQNLWKRYAITLRTRNLESVSKVLHIKYWLVSTLTKISVIYLFRLLPHRSSDKRGDFREKYVKFLIEMLMGTNLAPAVRQSVGTTLNGIVKGKRIKWGSSLTVEYEDSKVKLSDEILEMMKKLHK